MQITTLMSTNWAGCEPIQSGTQDGVPAKGCENQTQFQFRGDQEPEDRGGNIRGEGGLGSILLQKREECDHCQQGPCKGTDADGAGQHHEYYSQCGQQTAQSHLSAFHQSNT